MCYSALFILFIALNLLSMFIGNLVEIIKLPKYLNFKPINCKKCLSTWSSWTLHTIVALSICSWLYFIAGFLGGLVIFILIHLEEKKRWE